MMQRLSSFRRNPVVRHALYFTNYFVLAILICTITTANAQTSPRERKDFTANWRFHKGDIVHASQVNYNDADWRSLQLPHDWSIEGDFSEKNPSGLQGGWLPGGIGWYRKAFTLPGNSGDKKVYIDFDGVYRNSEVWINGHNLGKRPNGYISFRYDVTAYLQWGNKKNIIAVKVDNSMQPNSRWYSGSGIYRNVWLTITNGLHVDYNGTFITSSVSEGEASVNVKTAVRNSFRDQQFIVKTVIMTPDGREAGRASGKYRAAKGAVITVEQNIIIKGPALWSVDSPALYRAVSTLVADNRNADVYNTPFGIRYFNFDASKGFSLNGRSMKILGVCNHHDLGALGTAINVHALRRQLQLLKDMGCNGIRTSHNPPAPELLDLCDEIGFIVMDEAFDMWKKEKNTYDYHLDWDKWHKTDLEAQLLRDRNHPAVFIWSVGNEIVEQWGDAQKGDTSGRAIARELVSIVKALDTSRPVVAANNFTGKKNHLIQSEAFDLTGYNYHHDEWATFGKDMPGKKLIITESVSALETRGHYDPVPSDSMRRWPLSWDKPLGSLGNKDFTVSAYDHVSTPWGSTHEETWRILKKNNMVSGMYIWTGFDYLGEPTPYSWPARSSYFGIIDLAGFPKDVYYMYQSEWTSKPILHLFPHWNWNRGDTVDMVAYYNNADEVELFINGRSQGVRSKTTDTFHVKWRVPYEAGVVKAVSRKNGETVMVKEITTAGAAAGIVLTADKKMIGADGRDLCFIKVSIIDKNAVPVPGANGVVNFRVKGPAIIAGVDNGSPVSHEPFKATRHTAMNGLVLAILQSTGQKGDIILTASIDGLPSSYITISAN